MYLKFKVILVAFAISFASCLKGDPEPPGPEPEPTDNGQTVYFINSTDESASSGTVTKYNLTDEKISITTCAFFASNARKLGQDASSIVVHGGKIYIVVSGTNTVEVVNRSNLHSIAKITAPEPYTGLSKITAFKNKVYVTSSAGYLCQIDTATFAIEKGIEVGPDPKDLCIKNGNIYVCNTDSRNPSSTGGSISKIEIESLTETKRIPVQKIPEQIVADNSSSGGYLYFTCAGELKPDVYRMNVTDQIEAICEANVFALKDKFLYCYNHNAKEVADRFFLYDTTKDMVKEFGINVEGVPTLIGVNDNKIYIASVTDAAAPSHITIFNNRNLMLSKFDAGVSTVAIAFDPEDGF